MNSEEKAIWTQHQERLAEISSERTKIIKDYELRREAVAASLDGQPEIAKQERQKLGAEITGKLKDIEKGESLEIGRYMSEMDRYDQNKAVGKVKNPEQEETLEQEKARKVDELLKEMNKAKEKEVIQEQNPGEIEKKDREEKVKKLMQQMAQSRDDLTKDRRR